MAARDFRDTFAALEPGDLVYRGPPYLPLSGTAGVCIPGQAAAKNCRARPPLYLKPFMA
jgi:hypothetical protein